LQKLKESGDVEKYRMHHLSYFLKIAEQAYEERLESQSLWLNRLVAEHTNMVAALKWSDNQSPNEFVRLSGALGWFWWMRSHFLLGKGYLEKALLKKIDKSEEYARSLLGLGMILWFTGDNQTRSINLLNESLDIWRQSNNLQEAAYVLAQLSFSHHIFGDHETGIKCSEQSLDSAEITRNPMLINHCLTALCTSLICMKKFDQAKPVAEKLLVSSEELKQPYGLLRAHHYISDCALAGRNFKDAEKKYGLAVKTSIKYGDIVQATHDLHGVAFSISGQSRWAKAIRLNGAVCEKYITMGISMPGTITFWHEWIDIYIEGAKKQVGEELTRKYEEEGRNMGFEAAVEYALDFDKD
jgi:tetratricopeptide (TPR) repeat protein